MSKSLTIIWQYIIKGAIIIFAVALDSLKYARKK
ncbi:Galactose/methyl galactoside ABC transport system [Klebsiella pneumoniae]|nr:Galactose/methyl galactoside ABC transport system [Klebsiella pneumoniae]